MVWVKTKSTFSENLAQMPEIDDVISITLVETSWRHRLKKMFDIPTRLHEKKTERAHITHKDPDLLRLFYYLAITMGELNKNSARRAYELLADQAAHAQQHPGQHAALAALVEVLSTNQTFEIKLELQKKEQKSEATSEQE